MNHTKGRTICFVYLDEKHETNVAVTTLGVKCFPCTVSAVGHVCIMTRFVGRAALLRPSAARKKEPLVARVGGDRYSFCDFGRIIRPDIVIQMRDNS